MKNKNIYILKPGGQFGDENVYDFIEEKNQQQRTYYKNFLRKAVKGVENDLALMESGAFKLQDGRFFPQVRRSTQSWMKKEKEEKLLHCKEVLNIMEKEDSKRQQSSGRFLNKEDILKMLEKKTGYHYAKTTLDNKLSAYRKEGNDFVGKFSRRNSMGKKGRVYFYNLKDVQAFLEWELSKSYSSF